MFLCFPVEDFSPWQGTAVKASAELSLFFWQEKQLQSEVCWHLSKYSSLFYKGSWQAVGILTKLKTNKVPPVSGEGMSSCQVFQVKAHNLSYSKRCLETHACVLGVFLRPKSHHDFYYTHRSWAKIYTSKPRQQTLIEEWIIKYFWYIFVTNPSQTKSHYACVCRVSPNIYFFNNFWYALKFSHAKIIF